MVSAICKMRQTEVGAAREVLAWDGGEDEAGNAIAAESLFIGENGLWFLAKAGSAETHADAPIEFVSAFEVCEWLAKRSV